MSFETQARTIKLSELTKYAKHHFATKRPIMVWGPPGIGKSDTFKGIKESYEAEGKSCLLIDCRLSLWEPTDLKGYPYYNQETNRMSFSAPDELPSEEEAAEYFEYRPGQEENLFDFYQPGQTGGFTEPSTATGKLFELREVA